MSKYRAKPTTVDGVRFASQKEARRYQELKLLERAGEICHIELQPSFEIKIGNQPVVIRSGGFPNGRRVKYVADFGYTQIDKDGGHLVIEDVKGMDTPVSRLKRALVEAIYGVEVKII